MTGRQLKQIIERSGIRANAFAEKMGISPQSLNSVFNSADVKSGTIEKVAEVMGVPIATMYGDINAPVAFGNSGDNSVNGVGVPYDALRKRDEQIDRLLNIIEKMQGK